MLMFLTDIDNGTSNALDLKFTLFTETCFSIKEKLNIVVFTDLLKVFTVEEWNSDVLDRGFSLGKW